MERGREEKSSKMEESEEKPEGATISRFIFISLSLPKNGLSAAAGVEHCCRHLPLRFTKRGVAASSSPVQLQGLEPRPGQVCLKSATVGGEDLSQHPGSPGFPFAGPHVELRKPSARCFDCQRVCWL